LPARTRGGECHAQPSRRGIGTEPEKPEAHIDDTVERTCPEDPDEVVDRPLLVADGEDGLGLARVMLGSVDCLLV